MPYVWLSSYLTLPRLLHFTLFAMNIAIFTIIYSAHLGTAAAAAVREYYVTSCGQHYRNRVSACLTDSPAPKIRGTAISMCQCTMFY